MNANTKPSRYPSRSIEDWEEIAQIVDQGKLCHVAYQVDGVPYCLPTTFHREGKKVYLHGSVKSHFLATVGSGIPVSITVSHFDELVIARSVLNHSINYRSAMLFGRGRVIDEPTEKESRLKAFVEHLIPGQWEQVRQPSAGELAATGVVEVAIEQASAKQRTGDAGKESQLKESPDVWTGVIPLVKSWGEPQTAPYHEGEIPSNLKNLNY